jgi:hypothetical protein
VVKNGIERLPLDVRCHTDTIVGKNYLNVILDRLSRRNGKSYRLPVGKHVIGGV